MQLQNAVSVNLVLFWNSHSEYCKCITDILNWLTLLQLISTPIGPPIAPHPSPPPLLESFPELVLPQPSSLYSVPSGKMHHPIPVFPVPPTPLITEESESADVNALPQSECTTSLPVYDGFASMSSEPSLTPSAQFFYQDIVSFN